MDIAVYIILGLVIFCLAFRIIKSTTSPIFLLLLVVPVVVMVVYFKQWTLTSGNKYIFALCGVVISYIIGMWLEHKFIRYDDKTNLYLVFAKVVTTIVVAGSYIVCMFFLSGNMLCYFAKWLVLGFILTLILPFVFSQYDKRLYVFSKQVDMNRVVLSKISLSPKYTSLIAKILTAYISTGDVVILDGDLGAGKSELVRGYLVAKGVKNKITSPTFTLVNEHFSQSGEHFYHFDLYRINDEDEVKNLDFEEIIDDKNSTKFIEWADKAPSYMPLHYKKITIVKLGTNTRNIILEKY